MMDVIRKYIYSEPSRHILFWGGLYACFVLFGIEDRESNSLVFLEEGINLIAFIAIVYFNFHILIPLFLSKKKLLLFTGSLALFLALISPIIAVLLKWVYRTYGETKLEQSVDLRMVLLACALVAILSTVFQILSEWFRHERDRRELESQKTQSELRFLKSQINPHFLFNTLNNLYALTLKKSDDAPAIVLKLSDMMRYMLYECNEKKVPISKEIRYIENYLDLEKIRQGNHVDIQFKIDGDVEDQKVAPLLFIPFIENCFKHGVNLQLDNAFVQLNMSVTDREVKMLLKNSKPNIVPGGSPARKDGGIGLVNVKHQLNLLYPKQHQLNIEDGPLTYQVNLKIKFDS